MVIALDSFSKRQIILRLWAGNNARRAALLRLNGSLQLKGPLPIQLLSWLPSIFPLPGILDAPFWCLSWQLMRPSFALRWAFSRRLPSAHRHRSFLHFLLSVGYSCVYGQPNMKSPVCGVPQTQLPAPPPLRGLKLTTPWRRVGYRPHLKDIDGKCSDPSRLQVLSCQTAVKVLSNTLVICSTAEISYSTGSEQY